MALERDLEDRRGLTGYEGDEDAQKVFDTMPPRAVGERRVTFGTIDHAARQAGYSGPPAQPSSAEVFKDYAEKLAKEAKAENRSITVRASEIVEKPVNWLWYPYLPGGHISLLCGRGGDGKGLVASSLAAAVATGGQWPTSATERARKGRVLWCEAEDTPSETLKPRWVAAGADCDKIDVVQTKTFASLDLKTHVKATNTVLIIFSPLPVFLKGLQDMNSELDARRALEQVQEAIEDTHCAALGIAHLNKKSDLAAIERVLGSVAFTNFVRSVLFVSCEDRDAATYRFAHAKHNLSRKGDDLMYAPECIGPNQRGQRVRVKWSSAEANADVETMYDRKKKSGGKQSAKDWLFAFLVHKGNVIKDDVVKAGAEAGFSEAALEKALERGEHFQWERIGFPGKTFWWVKKA